MTPINLTGQLICRNNEEVSIVEAYLPRHVELTRSELGCISFQVNPTDDPRVWEVAESFKDAVSFTSHQERVKASEWGQATAAIKRDYSVSGL